MLTNVKTGKQIRLPSKPVMKFADTDYGVAYAFYLEHMGIGIYSESRHDTQEKLATALIFEGLAVQS